MNARRLDVGVDCWNYAPISFDEIVAEMAKVKFEPVDHHREDL
jgi:calcineurin-like phosphoesterase family protein